MKVVAALHEPRHRDKAKASALFAFTCAA